MACEARQFIDTLLRPNDIVEVRLIDQAGTLPPRRYWKRAGRVHHDLAAYRHANARGYGVFISVNPRRTFRASGDASVAAGSVLFADIDEPSLGLPGAAAARAAAVALPPPTVVVATGGGVQLHWRLLEPLADLGSWRRLETGLVAAVAGDANCQNPERTLRLPSFSNTKPVRHGAVVRILSLGDPGGVPVAAFERVLRPRTRRPARAAAPVPVADHAPMTTARSADGPAAALLAQIPPHSLSYHDWLRVSAAALHCNIPFGAWDTWCQQDAVRYDERANRQLWDRLARPCARPAGIGTLLHFARRA